MKCSDRSRVQPNRDLNAAINVLRLLTTELEEQGRLARSKPEVRAIESGRGISQRKSSQMLVLVQMALDPNVWTHASVTLVHTFRFTTTRVSAQRLPAQ
jgi:hypothetical protein